MLSFSTHKGSCGKASKAKVSVLGADGFTLVELVVSSAIIIAVLAGFTTFASNFSQNQRILTERGVAERLMQNEMEKIYALPWSKLVSDARSGADFTGRLEDCEADPGSLPSTVETVPMLRAISDGAYLKKDAKVIRTVEWYDGSKVTCANVNTKSGLRKLTVTIQWEVSGGKTAAVTSSVYRSEFASPQN